MATVTDTIAQPIAQPAVITLPHCYTVTVPSTSQHYPEDARIAFSTLRRQTLREVQEYLSSCFGGCTTTEGSGAWINGEGTLIVENVTIVTAYCNDEQYSQSHLESFYGDFSLLQNLAERIKLTLFQDTVLYTDDGVAYLI